MDSKEIDRVKIDIDSKEIDRFWIDIDSSIPWENISVNIPWENFFKLTLLSRFSNLLFKNVLIKVL